MTLSSTQQAAFSAIRDIVHTPSGARVLLTGYAGTGKTFTLAVLVDQLVKDRKRVLVAAPTHKAARCLEKALARHGSSVQVVETVARILKLRRVRDYDTGQETFEPPDNLPPWFGDVLIIDEASMIAQSHYSKLASILQRDQTLVFVGDPAQVPPVEDGKLCSVFEDADVKLALTEVVRHSGPILSLATDTRRRDVGRGRYRGVKAAESSVRAHATRAEWLQSFYDAACDPRAFEDTDFVRAVCFTNLHASELNAAVRLRRYGENAPPYCEGEVLIAHRAIPDPDSPTGYPLIHSSAEMRVIATERFEAPVVHDNTALVAIAQNGKRNYDAGKTDVPPWLFWRLTVELETGRRLRFNTLDPSSRERWAKVRGNLHAMARRNEGIQRRSIYSVIFQREDQFGKVQAAAALTVHKSQGSTFQRVWLHWDTDGFGGPLRPIYNRLAYVGITRAAEELHVVADA